jgi:hypothetical protein
MVGLPFIHMKVEVANMIPEVSLQDDQDVGGSRPGLLLARINCLGRGISSTKFADGLVVRVLYYS